MSREGATVTITPVTSTPGTKNHPVLSPDGNRVAFIWLDANGESEIYVKDLASDVTTQVTHTKGGENYPAWSPDGRFLAFYRLFRNDPGKPTATIRIVPAEGGPERVMGKEMEGCSGGAGLVTRRPAPRGKHEDVPRRTAAPVTTRRRQPGTRWITTPPPGSIGDMRPVFSPDGDSVAFVRNTGSETALYILQLATAGLSRVPIGTHDVRGITWTKTVEP